ncbi:dipeptidase [Aciduricibacillus chroicocephali]|uniref:Dipeptidase n=1 Tax=Aciduricibacillus chroicocephali TaxID=3054939 RepID=A0ABY9KXV7_9BACI|nr:dipeptidase [Bacillaceae bacterium 44XB]
MSEQVVSHLRENRERLLKKLNDFLRIPSISTDSKFAESVSEAADFLKTYLEDIGFGKVEKQETNGHPLVYAEYMEAGPDAPTVLFYGHYDVQPPDPLDQWVTPPFEPEIRDGRLYARGSSDDKGQVFMQLAVFEAFMKTKGKIPLNVKVCIEGEEEIGSENLYEILHEMKEKFSADFAVISDSGMVADNQPTILYGLKGFTGIEIEVEGPDHDLHSGMYGGAVRNPAMALAHLLASMKNTDEVVTVEGFYEGVEGLTDKERALIKSVPGEDFKASCGIAETASEKGYTPEEHTMARPTFEINGMYSGYQGEGTKTIIPATATAKITCRLVPGQEPEHIQELLEKHVLKHAPSGVRVHVKKEKLSAKAYKVEPNHPLIQKASESYSKAFGKETVYVRMGGSIPVVEWIDALYDVPVVLLGFGTPDDRLHSPNESFPLDSFDKGMETLAYYWSSFSK